MFNPIATVGAKVNPPSLAPTPPSRFGAADRRKMELDFTKITDSQPAEIIPEVLPAEKKRGRPKGVKNGEGALTRGPDMSPLKREERKACHELLTGCSKSEAIRRAYGGTVADPNKYAYQVFNKPKVKQYLQQIQEKQLKKVDIDAEAVLLELKKLGFSSIRDYLEFGPGKVDLFDSKTISPEALSAISSISMTEGKFGNTVKFTLHDKIKALELLGKNYGIFTEKIEVGVRPIFTFGGEDGEG